MNDAQIIEFIAPFALENCAQRLQNRHEPPAFWAWGWQLRTVASVTPVDAHTMRFRLKRVDKNSYLPFGSLAVVSGYLRRLDGGRTAVVAETRIVYFWIILPVAVFGLGVGLVALTPGEGANAAPPVLVMAAIGGGAFLFTWWWALAQLRALVGALKQALGQFA